MWTLITTMTFLRSQLHVTPVCTVQPVYTAHKMTQEVNSRHMGRKAKKVSLKKRKQKHSGKKTEDRKTERRASWVPRDFPIPASKPLVWLASDFRASIYLIPLSPPPWPAWVKALPPLMPALPVTHPRQCVLQPSWWAPQTTVWILWAQHHSQCLL